MVRDRAPDVVLLDLNIPVVSGAEVLETLKADPTTSDVLVVVVTATGEEGRRKAHRRRAPTATSRSRSARSPCSGQWSGYFEVPGRRYRDGERRSVARLRLQGDPAPHRLRQLPRDVEAESGALRVGRRRFGLMEAVEDRLALLGRHARARGRAPRT